MSKASKNTTKRPARKSVAGVSFYDLYPMPFFDKATNCAWAVKPTGNYSEDCETGREYARLFLASCDGTIGWRTVLSQIVSDMVRMGPARRFPDGGVTCGGIVNGFMGAISSALIVGQVYERAADLAASK